MLKFHVPVTHLKNYQSDKWQQPSIKACYWLELFSKWSRKRDREEGPLCLVSERRVWGLSSRCVSTVKVKCVFWARAKKQSLWKGQKCISVTRNERKLVPSESGDHPQLYLHLGRPSAAFNSCVLIYSKLLCLPGILCFGLTFPGRKQKKKGLST